MSNYLEYPFDSKLLIRKKRSIRRELINTADSLPEKKIAILGGSTTAEIKDMLELFLLNNSIKPIFYESGFGQFWEDAVFSSPELDEFSPDFIYIHTTVRNITTYPKMKDKKSDVQELLDTTFNKYVQAWSCLKARYSCPVIQNNFELPEIRRFGNLDCVDHRGKVRFIEALNTRFAQYAEANDSFYINDLNYISSTFGLDKWFDSSVWYLYRYACSADAFPSIAFSVANIIKSLIGKNKKCLVVDLDNTLWGGVIGDDGIEGIELSEGSPCGEAFRAVQEYIKGLTDIGIVLAVNSKNDEKTARLGFTHPDSVLKVEDFVSFYANWNTKAQNMQDIAHELNLGADSFVFLDDNPAERLIVKKSIQDIGCINFDHIEDVPRLIDRSGFFEITSISEDDLNRQQMYQANAKRRALEVTSINYNDYLKSLQMKSHIKPITPLTLARVTQLINKTNQFNLTTRRVQQSEIEKWACDNHRIALYADLSDKYGDNGLVSALIGSISGDTFFIDIWVMSCRVFRRGLENAMMNKLVGMCSERGISQIYGEYIPTKKNEYVRDLYSRMSFSCANTSDSGRSVWNLEVASYRPLDVAIELKES